MEHSIKEEGVQTSKEIKTALEEKLLIIREQMGEDVICSILVTSEGTFDLQHVTKRKLFDDLDGENITAEVTQNYPEVKTNNSLMTYFG